MLIIILKNLLKKNLFKLGVVSLTASTLATPSIGTLSARADSNDNDVNSQTIDTNTFSTGNNNTLSINSRSEDKTVSGNQYLNNLKANNPSIYDKMDQNTINEIKNISNVASVSVQNTNPLDASLQGGTYVKLNKYTYTVYINSALVKVAKWAGGGAIVAAFTYGTITALPTGMASEMAAGALSSVIAGAIGSIGSDRGAWIRFYNGSTVIDTFGEQ